MVISAARAKRYSKHSYSIFRVCYCGFLCPSSRFNGSPISNYWFHYQPHLYYLSSGFLNCFFFFGIRLLICCDIPENAFYSRDFRNEQKSKPKGLMSITEGMENIRQCSVREVRGCISSESNQWVESLVGKPWRFPQLLAEPLKWKTAFKIHFKVYF